MTGRFSPELLTLYENGPFPGQIDPWAEAAHYFQSIHSSLIENIITQIRTPLLAMGYVIGKETSLQIAEGREPDIFVHTATDPLQAPQRWDYALAAAEVLAQPGLVVQDVSPLESIRITEAETGRLVTIVEVVSPGNKVKTLEIAGYQQRRARLVQDKGVHVVEIDLTRSVKRLTSNALTQESAYHVAVFVVGEWLRVISMAFGQPLERIALPLREEVVPVDLQKAYDYAYRLVNIAWHIQNDHRYTAHDLPFASLLTDVQKERMLQAVEDWKATLESSKKHDN